MKRLNLRFVAAFKIRIPALLVLALVGRGALAQRRAMDPPSTVDVSHRTRLILKDGTYQVVLAYKVDGGVVRYRSAERGGQVEEIPAAQVDFDATHKWEAEHASEQAVRPAPVLSPKLQKEEDARAARTPEVAPNLRLPDEDSVLALDSFQGVPELVPLSQQGGDLNKETAHNMLRAALNPLASAHQILEIPGEHADVKLHVKEPVLYVRVGKEDEDTGVVGGFTVDTHGASGRETPSGGSEKSSYVIVHVDEREGSRIVASFRINLLGGVKRQADVIETDAELLPGGHWLRLKPRAPLELGEYALVEIISEHEINLGVWDFGVNATALENGEAIKPEEPKPLTLERR